MTISAPRIDESPYARAQRRTLTVLVTAQALSGAGLAAGVTVGALLAQDMLGSTSLAGLPSALGTAGSALAAVAVGRISQAHGRRPGLVTGYLIGALGSAGVIAAAVAGNPTLLFLAIFVYGAGTSTNLQARYAGADLADPAHRARAVSTVLVATTLGGVIGPNLTAPTSDLAHALGIPHLAGPFLLAGTAYALAALVLALWLRPDPLLLARTIATEPNAPTYGANESGAAPSSADEFSAVGFSTAPSSTTESGVVSLSAAATSATPSGAKESSAAASGAAPSHATESSTEPSDTGSSTALLSATTSAATVSERHRDMGHPRHRTVEKPSAGVLVGALIMVVTQLVMVAIMTMTPVQMHDHGHSAAAAGMVIAIHIGAMYLPAPVTGWLVDRYGRYPIAAASGLTLLAAGIVAARAPGDSVALLTVALTLLGIGWNFGLVTGTAIITDAAPLATRAKTQGLVDVSIAVAGAAGGTLSGLVVAAAGYPLLALGGGIVALAVVPAVIVGARRSAG
ncbi:MFS transporter [Nocardia sp. NPDC052566]|uniref:MFS transporter n=1 Tax=Nocardia sp. NPDC052566 TaxID=3364330 RepID=UPI0037C5A3A1